MIPDQAGIRRSAQGHAILDGIIKQNKKATRIPLVSFGKHIEGRITTTGTAREVTNSLIIYTKTGCPYCEGAKRHFTAQGIQFEEVNLSVHRERIQEIKQLTNNTMVPVIVDNGQVTVGFNGGG